MQSLEIIVCEDDRENERMREQGKIIAVQKRVGNEKKKKK